VIVGGTFLGAVDFGGGPLSPVGFGADMFVAVYTFDGDHVWSDRWGPATSLGTTRRVMDIAVDSGDDIVAYGEFTGEIDFGTKVLDDGPGVEPTVFVAKLTDGGTHVWSLALGTAAFQQLAGGIVLTPTDDVVLAASMEGTVGFGATSHTSAGGFDVLVAKLDANGNHLWSKRYGDAAEQQVHGVALAASGNLIVTGGFSGELNFGGGTLTSAGADDVFVAALDASGAHLWSKPFGAVADQRGSRVTTDSQDNVIVTGSFAGSTDFGGGALTSIGGDDVFLVKLAESGNHIWSKRYGDNALQGAAALVAAPEERLLFGAVVEGSIDFGGNKLTSAGQEDVALALLGP